MEFINIIWKKRTFLDTRKAAVAFILRQLTRGRHEDYTKLLRVVLNFSEVDDDLREFVIYWLRGHMIPLERVIDGRV